jgi:glycerol kinase
MNLHTLKWDDRMLKFFDLRSSILPKLVSSSEVYGHIADGPLKGIPIGGLVGDQQGALVGNKCLKGGEAKCTYGTGAFLLFCTGEEIVQSSHGLLSTVTAILVNPTSTTETLVRLHTNLALAPLLCTP